MKNLVRLSAEEHRKKPKLTRTAPTRETLKGPSLSCSRPATMNVSAKTTTAIMNTLEVSARFQWNSFSNGATKTLQAYSEPSARFMDTPPTTRHQRLIPRAPVSDATFALATVFLLYEYEVRTRSRPFCTTTTTPVRLVQAASSNGPQLSRDIIRRSNLRR